MTKIPFNLPVILRMSVITLLLMVLPGLAADVASAQEKKPNILVIWGDDIGGFNISAYNRGMMGYIPRLTDYPKKRLARMVRRDSGVCDDSPWFSDRR